MKSEQEIIDTATINLQSAIITKLMSPLGRVKTPAKTAAAKRNGKRGRPGCV